MSAIHRIELALPEHATALERYELGTIARYCIARVEDTVGVPDSWFLRVGAVKGLFACTVVIHDAGCAIETTSIEADGARAIWDAVGEVEVVLRDVRRSRSWRTTRRKAA